VRQLVLVEVPALSPRRCVVGVPRRRAGRRRLMKWGQCHHHAPLSALLLSAVHPVTLYTHTQPSTAHCKQ
jgi:hypothetical protein